MTLYEVLLRSAIWLAVNAVNSDFPGNETKLAAAVDSTIEHAHIRIVSDTEMAKVCASKKGMVTTGCVHRSDPDTILILWEHEFDLRVLAHELYHVLVFKVHGWHDHCGKGIRGLSTESDQEGCK